MGSSVLKNSCVTNPQVLISEPEFVDDPAAVATLTVLRSAGGEGSVTLTWKLEDSAVDDLSPVNGTLVFNQVWVENGCFCATFIFANFFLNYYQTIIIP